MFIYFFIEKERDRERVEKGQRAGDTESEVSSRIQAISTEPDMGLELMNHEIVT